MFADDDGPEFQAAPVGLAVDDERLAGLDDPARQTFAVLERLQLIAILVGEVDGAGLPIVQRDVGDIGLEDRADLLADQLEQLGKVELARELLRHRVDCSELSGALLRLGKEARVFDGDGRLQRQADQEFEIGVAERLAARAPHRHRAFDFLPGQ